MVMDYLSGSTCALLVYIVENTSARSVSPGEHLSQSRPLL